MAGALRWTRYLARLKVPAAAFGTGYGCCWAQSREETAPQLLACAVARSWVGLATSLRLLGRSLPESATWPREKLAQVEIHELRLLAAIVAACAARGLDSALLRRIALWHLCALVEAEPTAGAALGLAPDGMINLPLLAAHVDDAVTALAVAGAGSPEPEQLPGLASALHALLVAGGPAWHKELAPDGVLHLAHAAMVGNAWLAAWLRQRAIASPAAAAPTGALSLAAGYRGAATGCLSEEDEQVAIQNLTAVWQALGQLPSGSRVGLRPSRSRGTEAAELHRDLEARHMALQVPPALPPAQSLPPQDALPHKLRRSVAAALQGTTTEPMLAAQLTPCSSEDLGSEGSALRKVWMVCTFGAWAVLIGAAAVALSSDGLGILGFHAVPPPWRGPLRSLLQQRGVQVEELLAKDSVEGGEESIILGPWGAQSSYIQAPSAPEPPQTH